MKISNVRAAHRHRAFMADGRAGYVHLCAIIRLLFSFSGLIVPIVVNLNDAMTQIFRIGFEAEIYLEDLRLI